MKYLFTFILSAFFFGSNAQNLKPYILGSTTSKSVEESKEEIIGSLKSNGFDVLGSYIPATDNNRMIIVVSHPELIDAVARVGDLTGFAMALRVGVTRESNETFISYTNPMYWGHAYFRDDFETVAPDYQAIEEAFTSSMKAIGTYKGTAFGSKNGIEPYDLHDYQYMMGMPEFDDTNVVGEFATFADAVAQIDKNLNGSVPNVKLVYKKEIPEKQLALYGVALSGEEGEEHFLPIIDISSPKHTAFLPYEILVMGNEVHMLHGRYRIALSFPDLTMGTFTKIMSSPGDIEELMKTVTGQK